MVGQSFGYDGFGNLLTKAPTAGHSATAMSLTVNPATNRLTNPGFGYDANGNMTSIPASPSNITPVYDMENRTGGTWFDLENQPLDRDGQWNLYGLNGERLGTFTYTVQSNTIIFGGQVFIVRSATGTQTSRNIYFGGRLIQSNGSTVAADRLGSVRANEGGTVPEYYPYGEEISHTADGREKFATYTRESSGLDYANQRYYMSQFGRFATPDPDQASAGGADPSSWNRYSYTGGDPVNRLDPQGNQFIEFVPVCGAFGCEEGPALYCGDGAPWDPLCASFGYEPPINLCSWNPFDASCGYPGGNGLLGTPTLAPPVAAPNGIGSTLWNIVTGITGAIGGAPGAIVIGVLFPTPTGGMFSDTVPTVEQIRRYCLPVGPPVDVPSTNTRNKGGRSVEQTYLCPDGSYWTIQTIYKRNGGIFAPPHIRPGLPKYGR